MMEQEKIAWSFGVPLLVAIIPATLFRIMGLIGSLLSDANGEPPVWAMVVMIALQLLGMVTMAIVFLIRWDYSFHKLSILTAGKPHVIRRFSLILSFTCLLIFDLFFNVAAALSGALNIAVFLWIASTPFFAGFVLAYGLSFYKLT